MCTYPLEAHEADYADVLDAIDRVFQGGHHPP
jgi:hypothetical protein